MIQRNKNFGRFAFDRLTGFIGVIVSYSQSAVGSDQYKLQQFQSTIDGITTEDKFVWVDVERVKMDFTVDAFDFSFGDNEIGL